MRTTFPTVKIFGLPISKLNMEQTLQLLLEHIEARHTTHVVTVNPIMIMDGLQKPVHMDMLRGADMLVPDGTGVVWAASRIGDPVAERVPGIELMHKLMEQADKRGWRVYLLGASPDSIRGAYEKLTAKFPGARFVGYRDGYFTEAEDVEVIADIRALQPDLLFVARSADNQDVWIHRYRRELQVPLMMGIGGSIDVISGRVKRAPVLFQKLRLEWFYRLMKEPFRAKRMLALPKFVVKVLRGHENPNNL